MILGSNIVGLLILLLVIILFLTNWIPSAVAAVIGCLLFVATGICSASEIFAPMADSTVILVVGMLIVGEAMFNTGVAYDAGNFILRITHHDERRIIFFTGLISALLSSFLSNVSVIAMAISIINSITSVSTKIKKIQLYLPIIMGASFGGILTLVGSTPQITALGILQKMNGGTLHVFDFTPGGIVLVAIYLAYVTIVGPKLGEKIWGDRDTEYDVAEDIKKIKQDAIVPSYSKRKKIIMLLIFIMMIILFATEKFSVAFTSVLGAILCVVFGLTNENSALKSVDWRIIIRLGGCLGIAKGLQISGFGELISHAFIALFGNQIPAIVFLGASVLLVMIVSNFITNSTAVVIVLPPTLAICSSLHFNPVAFTLAIAYGANLCFCTPLASAQMALALAGGYRFSDYFKYNIILEILTYIAIITVVSILYPLTN